MEPVGYVKLWRKTRTDEKLRELSVQQRYVFLMYLTLAHNGGRHAGRICTENGRPLSQTERASAIDCSKTLIKSADKALIESSLVAYVDEPTGHKQVRCICIPNFPKYQHIREEPGLTEARSDETGVCEDPVGGADVVDEVKPGRQPGFTKTRFRDQLQPGLTETRLELESPENAETTLPATGVCQDPVDSMNLRSKEVTSRTSTSKATPSSADDTLGLDIEPEKPISEARPANTEKAQLVQELWEAFGFEGSPPSKKPAAYSGAIRLVDGKFAVARELIEHLKRSPPKPEDGETPGAFFTAVLRTMLAAPPGVGWRKAGTSWQTEIPKPPPAEDPNRLSFRR